MVWSWHGEVSGWAAGAPGARGLGGTASVRAGPPCGVGVLSNCCECAPDPSLDLTFDAMQRQQAAAAQARAPQRHRVLHKLARHHREVGTQMLDQAPVRIENWHRLLPLPSGLLPVQGTGWPRARVGTNDTSCGRPTDPRGRRGCRPVGTTTMSEHADAILTVVQSGWMRATRFGRRTGSRPSAARRPLYRSRCSTTAAWSEAWCTAAVISG
jgi:hypothetical protein